MRLSLKVLAAPAVVAAVSLGTLVVVPASFAGEAEVSQAETYADYSMMFERSAGQFWADGQPAGQWAWNPQSEDGSHISWGSPETWPPEMAEVFVHDGDWVLLEGWHDNGTFYRLEVDTEQVGDGNCQNMRDLPTDGGAQRYARWTIPDSAYCLKAWGTIVEESTGTRIDFGHTQTWSPPARCSNAYYQGQTCIKQWESWWDNNGSPGSPIERRLERDQYLARGIGMAFKVVQFYPRPWSADLRFDWTW